jgi:hypothetical protein
VWIVTWMSVTLMIAIDDLIGDRFVLGGLTTVTAYFGARLLEWRWARDTVRERSAG